MGFGAAETIFPCMESNNKSLCPLGRLTVGKNLTNLLAVPSGRCSFSDLQQTITKINTAQPHRLTSAVICGEGEGLFLSERMLMAQGLGGVALSVGTDTAETRQLQTRSGICHLFILGFIVLQCKHIKHMLLNTEKIQRVSYSSVKTASVRNTKEEDLFAKDSRAKALCCL